MTAQTKVEPIRKSLELNCDAQTAFAFYTERLGAWWPFRTHSMGGENTVSAAMECREGGRLYETLADGTEKVWGRVLHWEPGKRLVHSWHLSREAATEVEIRFTDTGPGRCRVDLEHRNWEAWGEDVARLRDQYDSGWDKVFGEDYAGFVRQQMAA
ncbi:MAG: SRPBCC domain-containing protein [Alphaproteobacteria bacterium]